MNKQTVIDIDRDIHNTMETGSSYPKWKARKLILEETIV